MPSPRKVSPAPSFSDFISSVNCRSTDEPSYVEKKLVQEVRILHDLCSVERRTEHRGVRVLAAQAAPHAAFDHGRDRIAAQRIGIVLTCDRPPPRTPDAPISPPPGILPPPPLPPPPPLS